MDTRWSRAMLIMASSGRQCSRAPVHTRRHGPAYRMGDGAEASASSASATTVRVTAVASGQVAAGTLTTQMISPAVCALRRQCS